MKKLNSVIKTITGSALLAAMLFLFSNTSNANDLIAKGKVSLTSQKAQNSAVALSDKPDETKHSGCAAGKCDVCNKKADAKVKTAKSKVKEAKCGAEKCESGKCVCMDKKAESKAKTLKAKAAKRNGNK